ncbi:MAG TPA: hypothetical protein VK203_29315 [Nostocaceae cyanobacterium]|nr:hypothetical protein [Nostocaceae cyanobacterium]
MNRKLILALLSSSTIFTSLLSTLAIVNPAHAAEKLLYTRDGRACITHPHGSTSFVCIRASQAASVPNSVPSLTTATVETTDEKIAMLDFTEEESDAAIDLFGCDCAYCVNILRQLRGTGNLVY